MKFLWCILVYVCLVFRGNDDGSHLQSSVTNSGSGGVTAIVSPNDFDYVDFCDDDLPEIEQVLETVQEESSGFEIKLLPIAVAVGGLGAKLIIELSKYRKRNQKSQKQKWCEQQQVAIIDKNMSAGSRIETVRKTAAQQIEKFVHFSYTLPKFHLKQCDRNDNTLPFDLYRNENNEFFSKSF